MVLKNKDSVEATWFILYFGQDQLNWFTPKDNHRPTILIMQSVFGYRLNYVQQDIFFHFPKQVEASPLLL